MIKKQTVSFKNAIEGFVWAIKTEINYKIHLFLSTVAIIGGFVFKISYFEFLIILTLIVLGLTVEMINTALEETTNAIDQKQREDIRIAKDVSAAAMLTFSGGAFIIACVIFLPKIIALIKF